jgi:hypothetical protein
MYPSGELARLAQRKVILQARIAVRRWECASAAAELAKPIAVVDRGIELWRRFAPFIKLLGVPAGLLLLRRLRPGRNRKNDAAPRKKRGKIAGLIGALPVILRVARTVMALRTTLPSTSAAGGKRG